MQKLIYMDNAATTKTENRVKEVMMPYFDEKYSNPSGVYNFAKENRMVIDESRKKIAELINAKPEEIYFTSGGTESDNWVLKGICPDGANKHIITSRIEHHVILTTCESMEQRGSHVDYVNVNEFGKIKLEDIEKIISSNTSLISVMTANNEIGTIQPVKKIGQIAKKWGIPFHTDAVQAFGHIPINVDEMNIDMLSASGHKCGGPKGIGILYIRNNRKLMPFMHGGAQEKSVRAGTCNVPGIVGMGEAASICMENMVKKGNKISTMRDYMIGEILSHVSYTRLNGDSIDRLPNNINISFQFINGESLLFMLDEKGICTSTGSACLAQLPEASHVLMATGLPEELAYGSLRMTISHETTIKEIDYVVKEIISSVDKLRSFSESYKRYITQ